MIAAAWEAAAAGLLAAFALACLALARGDVPHRLAALPLAGTLASLTLAALGFADDQSATIDLALVLALLSVPGTLLFALFEERWL